jgi:hypothetical protein
METNNKVTMRTFLAIITTMALILIACFTYTFGAIRACDEHTTAIKEDVSAIKTDVTWIKEAIKNGK